MYPAAMSAACRCVPCSGASVKRRVAHALRQFDCATISALQERVIEPVGDPRERKVDVRVIAATNKNLLEAVANKDETAELNPGAMNAAVEAELSDMELRVTTPDCR